MNPSDPLSNTVEGSSPHYKVTLNHEYVRQYEEKIRDECGQGNKMQDSRLAQEVAGEYGQV